VDSLILFGVLLGIYALIKLFKLATNAQAKLQQLYSDKQEEIEQNQHSLSLAHRLVMQRKRIHDMALFNHFVVAEQNVKLHHWEAKVYHYHCRYLSELRNIEMNALLSDQVIINIAARTTERYMQNSEIHS
jgi:hypothetical protein